MGCSVAASLPVHFRAREPQRFHEPRAIRILHARARRFRRRAPLHLFHAFLKLGLGVDETFTCITHALPLTPSVDRTVATIVTVRAAVSTTSFSNSPQEWSATRTVHRKIDRCGMKPDAHRGPLEAFHPRCAMVHRVVRRADAAAGAGLAGDRDGESTLMLAPTGSGKTLAAFLWCINRLMFAAARRRRPRARAACSTSRRSRRWRWTSSATCARRSPASRDVADGARRCLHLSTRSAVRTGDTPAAERARFQREPADILITTPESLYLLLTSQRARVLRVGRHGHRRRDPRARADQARRAPRAVARAARGALRTAAAAHRPVGDAASARRGRAVPRRRRETPARLEAAVDGLRGHARDATPVTASHRRVRRRAATPAIAP